MSIGSDCREAVDRLASQGKVFTEFDIANEASGQGTKGWSGKMFQQAAKDAYTVLQAAYKRGKLVRYGPVEYQGNIDYVRRGTKIVYADATEGPEEFVTPNGTFARLHAEADTLLKVGRKKGTNRDDTKPWAEQMSGPPIDTEPLMRRIRELEDELRRTKAEAAATPLPDIPDEALNLLIERLSNGIGDTVAERVKERIAEALIS